MSKKQQSKVWQERSFPYVPMNGRDPKPRKKSITEIRGPYYAMVTPTYTKELLEGMGEHVDGFKFAGGSFSLMPADYVKKLNNICHDHDVYVSTGGWIENLLVRAPHHIDDYIAECKKLGFDMIELSTGFIQLPVPDLLRLIDKVHKAGLKAKPEIGIQFGAGGDSSKAELEAEVGHEVVRGIEAEVARHALGVIGIEAREHAIERRHEAAIGGGTLELQSAREENVVLLVDVLVEIEFHLPEPVQHRSVRAASVGGHRVAAGHRVDLLEQVAHHGVLADQGLDLRAERAGAAHRTGLLQPADRREHPPFFRGHVRVERSDRLDEQLVDPCQFGVVVAVDPMHLLHQCAQPRHLVPHVRVVGIDDVVREISAFLRRGGLADGVLRQVQRPAHVIEVEAGRGGGFGERPLAVTAIVETETLQDPGPATVFDHEVGQLGGCIDSHDPSLVTWEAAVYGRGGASAREK